MTVSVSRRWLPGLCVALSCAASCTAMFDGSDGDIVFQSRIDADVDETNPRINVKVNGTSAEMLLDTGSSHHVLTRPFAQANGIVASEERSGLLRARQFRLKAGRADFVIDDAIVLSPPFDEEGWGGILSPQSLLPAATVVLDFRNRVFYLLRGTRASTDSWLAEKYDSLRRTTLAREGTEINAVLVRGGQCGRAPVLLDIDSGIGRSRLSRKQLRGTALHPGGKSIDALGNVTLTEVARGQSVCFGDLRFDSVDLVAITETPSSESAADAISGSIGMDILRQTVLVIPPVPSKEILIFAQP